LINIYSFFDESGKFSDHAVVALGGVIGAQQQIREFDLAWNALLKEYGMPWLTMKKALNAGMPLGSNKAAMGIEERTEAIMRFVNCIKDRCELIIGCAIDVNAFKGASGATRIHLGKNPHFAAFARTLMELMAYLEEHGTPEHVLSIVCDDEEATAMPMYKLYLKIKRHYPAIRKYFSSISMADDGYYAGLQAADMVSSLIRFDARRQFLGEPYDYPSLYTRLQEDIDQSDRQANVRIGFCDSTMLAGLSAAFDEFAAQHPEHTLAPLVES
jgi:Protein of unknown function (DUF3800)